jgi:hypothetical protein
VTQSCLRESHAVRLTRDQSWAGRRAHRGLLEGTTRTLAAQFWMTDPLYTIDCQQPESELGPLFAASHHREPAIGGRWCAGSRRPASPSSLLGTADRLVRRIGANRLAGITGGDPRIRNGPSFRDQQLRIPRGQIEPFSDLVRSEIDTVDDVCELMGQSNSHAGFTITLPPNGFTRALG